MKILHLYKSQINLDVICKKRKKSMDKKSIQKKLLATVKDVSSINSSYIEELADILEISTDSVYIRLRGETDLTAQEAALICKHYRISFDNLIEVNDNSVSFNFKMIRSEDDFLYFFQKMKTDLIAINQSELPLLTYAAFDIPLFHHFSYPLLTEFKLFSWMYLPPYSLRISQTVILDIAIPPHYLNHPKDSKPDQ